MVRQPDFNANIGATYKHQVGAGSVEISANALYTGVFYWDVANSLREDPSAVANSRISYVLPNNKFTLSLFVNNVFDDKYNMMVLPSGFGSRAVAGRPRSFGVEIEAQF
jgi:iron complex outermembrane receptor protein